MKLRPVIRMRLLLRNLWPAAPWYVGGVLAAAYLFGLLEGAIAAFVGAAALAPWKSPSCAKTSTVSTLSLPDCDLRSPQSDPFHQRTRERVQQAWSTESHSQVIR